MQVWAVDGSTKYAIRNCGKIILRLNIIILTICRFKINVSISFVLLSTTIFQNLIFKLFFQCFLILNLFREYISFKLLYTNCPIFNLFISL